MTKSKPKLVTDYPVTSYACGARAGDKVRLRRKLEVRDHDGKIIATHKTGERWTVLKGTKDKASTIWLRQPDGKSHTWTDDDAFLELFEILKHP